MHLLVVSASEVYGKLIVPIRNSFAASKLYRILSASNEQIGQFSVCNNGSQTN